MTSERLELRFRIASPRDHAFRVFTEKVDLWWPRGHRGNPDAEMRFEPGVNGRLIERSGTGERAIGNIVGWNPPAGLAFNWWLGAERHPTLVDIRFDDRDASTEITILHTPGAAAEDGIWPSRVARFENGWTKTMAALASYVDAQED